MSSVNCHPFHSSPKCLIFIVLLLFFLLLVLASPAPAEWVPIGPDGGSAHVLALDARNPAHLLAGARAMLLYQSDDAGESWRYVSEFATSGQPYQTALNVIAIDPGDSQTYYAGVSATNARPAAENGAGIYKSTDAGQTWKRINSIAGISVYSLAIWEKDRHIMVAGTDRGVYRSADSGESWEHISPSDNHELQGVMSIAMDPKNASIIYAGTPHLPWKTADGGASWHNIHAGMIDDSDVFSIHIDRRNSERVYASACSGIYESMSAGASWTKFAGIPGDNRRTHVITQDPKHPSTLYAATTLGLWKSAGSGWRKTMTDSINALVLDPQGVMYLAVDKRGLLKSEDGGETFREINHGYINRAITTMQATGGGALEQRRVHPYLYASTIYDGSKGGLFRTDQAGKWELVASEEVLHGRNLVSFASLGDSGYLVAASYDGFLRSSDDGRTWTDMASRKEPDPAAPKGPATKRKAAPVVRPVARVLPGKGETPTFPSPKVHINSLKASTGKHSYLVAATSAGLFYSTTGVEWQLLKIVKTINLAVSAVFVSPGDTGGLAVVTKAGLYLSHDRGATWVSSAFPYHPEIVYEIAFDYQDPDLVLAATDEGIYQSINGGKTWDFRQGGMPEGEVTSVIFHPLHHGEAYALHWDWIYRSIDGGRTWKLFDRQDLGNVKFHTIAFDQSDSSPQLYGLSKLRGVFAYHTAVSTDTQNVTPHPHSAPN